MVDGDGFKPPLFFWNSALQADAFGHSANHPTERQTTKTKKARRPFGAIRAFPLQVRVCDALSVAHLPDCDCWIKKLIRIKSRRDERASLLRHEREPAQRARNHRAALTQTLGAA
jgi:hypothetical protein